MTIKSLMVTIQYIFFKVLLNILKFKICLIELYKLFHIIGHVINKQKSFPSVLTLN